MTSDAPVDLPALLDEVERLDREATPGPWTSGCNGHVRLVVSAPTRDQMRADIGARGCGRADQDAALIAAYREAAPTLAATVRRLVAENAQLRAQVKPQERPDASQGEPVGPQWRCYDCTHWATLSDNMIWHAHKTGHRIYPEPGAEAEAEWTAANRLHARANPEQP